MRNDPPSTPLLSILRDLKSDMRRDEFAGMAGTSRGYLYQLAGCYRGRRSCGTALAKGIADASLAMSKKYGTTPITMEQLATMCPQEPTKT